jgi:hypothetical protein
VRTQENLNPVSADQSRNQLTTQVEPRDPQDHDNPFLLTIPRIKMITPPPSAARRRQSLAPSADVAEVVQKRSPYDRRPRGGRHAVAAGGPHMNLLHEDVENETPMTNTLVQLEKDLRNDALQLANRVEEKEESSHQGLEQLSSESFDQKQDILFQGPPQLVTTFYEEQQLGRRLTQSPSKLVSTLFKDQPVKEVAPLAPSAQLDKKKKNEKLETIYRQQNHKSNDLKTLERASAERRLFSSQEAGLLAARTAKKAENPKEQLRKERASQQLDAKLEQLHKGHEEQQSGQYDKQLIKNMFNQTIEPKEQSFQDLTDQQSSQQLEQLRQELKSQLPVLQLLPHLNSALAYRSSSLIRYHSFSAVQYFWMCFHFL